MFRREREQKKVSQWAVAIRLQYHMRNIQRIEGGLRQPGVRLALRMAAVADADTGEFFEALFEEVASAVRDGASSAHKRVSVMCQPLGSVDDIRAFGVHCWLRHGWQSACRRPPWQKARAMTCAISMRQKKASKSLA